MPVAKRPCLQCKEKHVKCDEQKPKCGRCRAKNLSCARPARKTVFRNSGTGSFHPDQRWVDSEIKDRQLPIYNFKYFDDRIHTKRLTDQVSMDSQSFQTGVQPGDTISSDFQGLGAVPSPPTASNGAQYAHQHNSRSPQLYNQQGSPRATVDPRYASRARDPKKQTRDGHTHLENTFQPYLPTNAAGSFASGQQSRSPGSPGEPRPPYLRQSAAERTGRNSPQFPLKDPQEACLFRYFVEELSHWFDLCDDRRHFQLMVPIRARQHAPLLYSIFALAARHLTRIPKYQTPRGILYQGQLLPSLTEHDAVEYMLKCIPALREFHTIQDDESLESIVATAVILRQLEEIDDDEDDRPGRHSMAGESQERSGPSEQVNFLAIIDAVLRSPPSQSLFGRRSLIQAAYWMGVRQEIYHSFTRRQPPQMELDPVYSHGASKANKIVIHTAQVAKWRWADGSEQEWQRLQKQGEQLERDALREFQPFFSRPADRSSGEIFPTIWYSSALEVTSAQLSIIAKMVLMAENPYLRTQPTSRAQWREIENEVRRLLLDLCGICICHPACPPALVHAAFGLELYGDFFTDQYERDALRGVVDRLREARAWPVKKLSDMFR